MEFLIFLLLSTMLRMEGYGQWELTVSNLSEEENC